MTVNTTSYGSIPTRGNKIFIILFLFHHSNIIITNIQITYDIQNILFVIYVDNINKKYFISYIPFFISLVEHFWAESLSLTELDSFLTPFVSWYSLGLLTKPFVGS